MSEEERLLKPIPGLGLDEGDGHLAFMGERCALIFTDALAALRVSLQRIVGPNVGAPLLAMGRGVGERYTQIIFEKTPGLGQVHLETQIHELCSIILRNSGWGDINVEEIDLDEGFFVFKITGCPKPDGEEPIHHLEVGLLHGILQEVLVSRSRTSATLRRAAAEYV